MSEPHLESQRIYLDNAATSWPKPPQVYEAVERAMRVLGAPAGRGTYHEAAEVERGLADARRRIARLINTADPRRVIFTSNGTDSLNLALHGFLRPGDHVVTTVAEHNSVLRPLHFLRQHRDVTATFVQCDAAGFVDPDVIRQAITDRTRLIAVVHASNVTGAVQPIEAIGQIAAERGIRFLVDAAQSLGHVELDVRRSHVDMLAAPGHKGLLGPLGTGVLYVGEGVEAELLPTRQGGTGTTSESESQPESLPDRYESGNHNVPGLLGLAAGVRHVEQQGVARLRADAASLTKRLLDGLAAIEAVQLFGPRDSTDRIGVVSFRLAGLDPHDLASMLDTGFAIQTRAGLHCAPRMHQHLGTASAGGTLRISIGPFNTEAEIDTVITAVANLAALV